MLSQLPSMSLLTLLFSISMHQTVYGQVNYTVTTCSDPFDDISDIGNPLDLGDDDGEMVSIGFNFTFYGVSNERINISSNGYMTFGDDSTDPGWDTIPNSNDPNNLIAPLWADHDPTQNNGELDFITIGTSPNRYFVAQWKNVVHYYSVGSSSFQAILFEQCNCIEFRHDVIDYDEDTDNVVVGIENADGSDAERIDINSLFDLQSNACYKFCPNQDSPTMECTNTEQLIECETVIEPVIEPTCTHLPNGFAIDVTKEVSVISGECANTDTAQTIYSCEFCGRQTECTQTVTIQDTTPPIITCPDNIAISPTDESSDEFNPAATETGTAICKDSCDSQPIIRFSDTRTGGSAECGNILTRKWICTDDCGNESTCQQKISVICSGSSSDDTADTFNALVGEENSDNINDVDENDEIDNIKIINISFDKSVYFTVGFCGLCLIVFGLCICKNKNQEFTDQTSIV